MSPLVTIIILNWNNAADTLECLESVFQLDYPNYHVMVVDNGSTDDSVSRIRARYPELDIVETGENLGYAEGNNVGIRLSIESNCEYICMLNNDTLVAPGFLTALVSAMLVDHTIGMVGPKTFFHAPSDMIFSAGCSINWSRGEVTHRGIFQRDCDKKLAVYARTEDVSALAGCGVLVSKAAVQSVGLLNPTYFLNFEDIDWCMRMWSEGFRIRYVPEAILYHKVSATLGQDSPVNTYYMTRNCLRFFAQYGPRKQRALISIILRTLRTIGAWTVKPSFGSEVYQARRKATILALRDFAMGKDGPMETARTLVISKTVLRVL